MQSEEGIDHNIMSTKLEQKTYEDALGWLREHGFDLLEAPGTAGRVFLKKYNVSAAIQKADQDGFDFLPEGCVVDLDVGRRRHDWRFEPEFLLVILDASLDAGALTDVNGALANVVKNIDHRPCRPLLVNVRVKVLKSA